MLLRLLFSKLHIYVQLNRVFKVFHGLNFGKSLIFALFFLMYGVTQKVYAAPPTSVSTFHCIGLYWTPSSIDTTKKVLVQYRKTGTQHWFNGLSMIYNNVTTSSLQKGVYRGSIVNLTPNTSYEVKLTEEGAGGEVATLTETTMNETFSGTTVLTLTATRTTPLVINTSGTAGNYQIYNGNGQTIDLNNQHEVAITINADYIIIRNFKIKNATRHGIHLPGQNHHIVIEDCDISQWGSRDNGTWTCPDGTSGSNQGPNTNFGRFDDSAIFVYYNWDGPAASDLVIQRNKIHHPNYDTNNWDELHGKPCTDNSDNGYHPNGPGAVYLQNSGGHNIIRYNEIYSDSEHFFNDGLGGKQNYNLRGYPGPDSDLYGNYITFCQDDGIEAEGGGINVRIWNNYVENTLQGIANAVTRVGPMYMWRNVFGKGTTPAGGGVSGLYGVKMGYSGGIQNMTGYGYFFNNTFLQPQDPNDPTKTIGTGGLGTTSSLTSNRIIKRFVSRNNILHVRSRTGGFQAIARHTSSEKNDFDYDLTNAPAANWPTGHEAHGVEGIPDYIVGAGFDYTTLTGVFKVKTTSPGRDAGEVIPNFSEVYSDVAPDIGAHEGGNTPPMVFGVNASFVPEQLTVQTISFTSASTKTFGDAPFSLTATSNAGLPVTYSLISGPATLSGNTLTITGAGTIVVRASASGNGTYTSAQQDQTITVNKASQTIDFGAISNKVYPATTTVALSATASSGLAVSFSVVSGPATVSGSTLTLTGTGTVTVRASQAGNTNYNAAANVDRTFTVSSNYSGQLEAEDGVLVGSSIDSNNPGFTGTGFVNLLNTTGSSCQWTIDAPAAGTGVIKFRFANGTTSAQPLKLEVNGVVINAAYSFPSTGAWTTWSTTANINVNFVAGTNTVKLVSVTSHSVNLDHLKYEVLQSGQFEAENATIIGSAIESNNAGFTGTGFVNLLNTTGSSCEWTINKVNAGQVNIKFRYANGTTTAQPLKLEVNGAVVNSAYSFPSTSAWTTWGTTNGVNVNFIEGVNTVRLVTATSHSVNLDHLSFTSSASANRTAIAPQEDLLLISNVDGVNSNLSVAVSPNPASNLVKLNINHPKGDAILINFNNLSGQTVKSLVQNVTGTASEVSIPIDDLTSGVYIIRLEQGSDIIATKLVVQ